MLNGGSFNRICNKNTIVSLLLFFMLFLCIVWARSSVTWYDSNHDPIHIMESPMMESFLEWEITRNQLTYSSYTIIKALWLYIIDFLRLWSCLTYCVQYNCSFFFNLLPPQNSKFFIIESNTVNISWYCNFKGKRL